MVHGLNVIDDYLDRAQVLERTKGFEAGRIIGTSVTPYVYINKAPTGPNAGKFLQAYGPQPQTAGAQQKSPTADK